MKLPPHYPEDLNLLNSRLAEAVSRRLIEPGMAQRVRLSVHLHRQIYPRMYPRKTCVSQDGVQTGTVLSAIVDASSCGGEVSGEVLGRLLGLSRAGVGKHVRRLRESGFIIESAVGSGYRLTQPADDLLVGEAVIPYLLGWLDPAGEGHVGLPYIHRVICDSTNSVLRQMLGGDAAPPSGTVVVADHQHAGRGRLGRSWSNESGKDVLFSVLLRPALAPGRAHLLSLAAALGVARTLESLPGLAGRVKIKWPNDVLIDGSKVCGVLVEGSMDADRLHWAIAGIGVNVNSSPPALEREIAGRGDDGWMTRPRPSSLSGLAGRPVPRAPLVAALLRGLSESWRDLEGGETGAGRLLERLRALDALEGSQVEVRGGPGRSELIVAGRAVGIGAEGRLLVRRPSGETVFVAAGDVTVNRHAETG